MYKLKEVNIKNFRGYREEKIKIPKEADIILLTGNNGLGKTSFFDAIEWGITGQIKRYKPPSNERNSECFLKNKHANEQGYVNIIFEDEEGREVYIKRTTKEDRGNDYNPGILEINQNLKGAITDILVKSNKEKDFEFNKSFNFSHLLSQELISDFVRNHETERYSVLSNLIGFKNYDAYSKKLKELRKECNTQYRGLEKESGEKEKEVIKLKEKVKNFTDKDGKDLKTKYSKISMEISLHNSIDNSIFSQDVIDMDKNEVLEILREEKNNLDKKNTSYKEKLNKIIDLQEGKKDYSKWCNQQKKLRRIKEALDKKSKINFIKKNYESDLNEQELKVKINNISKKIVDLEEIIVIIEKKDMNIMEKLDLLVEKEVEIKKRFNNKILNFEELNKEINDINKELDDIENKIEEISNIEKKLLVGAHNYFLKNSSAEKCPVCLKKIEIEVDDLVSDLKERLEKEGGKLIKNYLEQKEDIEDDLEYNINERDKIKEKIEDQYLKLKDEVFKDYKIILDLKEKLNEKMDNIKKVKFYLQELNLEGTSDNIFDKLKEIEAKNNKVLLNDNYKRYTINNNSENLGQLTNQLEKLDDKINTYQVKLHNLGIDNISELKDTFKKTEEKISKVDYKIEKINEIISELDSIIKAIEVSKDNDKLKKLKKEISIIKKKIEFLKKKEKELKKIEKEVPTVINEMTEEILSPYKKLANTIYQKINPQPIYTRMDWEIDSTGHNNGTLRLKMYSDDGKEANPSYIYSSAQVNVIVLSLFLSFALQQNWSKLDAIFMDDPVQNMDDINIFSWIDVIRNIIFKKANSKQIFISTHDRKLSNFMKTKFRMLDVFVLDFVGYDKTGSKIKKGML